MATSYKISSSGVCTPSNSIALTVFKNIQREVNRFLDEADKTLLTIDGKIGQKTLDGINLVHTMFPTSGLLGGTATKCSQVADDPAGYYNALKAIADANELAIVMDPVSIVRTITNPQPRVDPSGSVSYPAPIATAGIGGVPYWLIAVVGGSYVYFFQTKSGKKQLKSLRGGF